MIKTKYNCITTAVISWGALYTLLLILYFFRWGALFPTLWLRKLSFREVKAILHRFTRLVKWGSESELPRAELVHSIKVMSTAERGVFGPNLVGNTGMRVRQMKREWSSGRGITQHRLCGGNEKGVWRMGKKWVWEEKRDNGEAAHTEWVAKADI